MGPLNCKPQKTLKIENKKTAIQKCLNYKDTRNTGKQTQNRTPKIRSEPRIANLSISTIWIGGTQKYKNKPLAIIAAD